MTTTFSPFTDGVINNLAGAAGLTAYGEPTVILSDDETQVDIWFSGTSSGVTRPWHGVSTNGTSWGTFAATDVSGGQFRPHCVKDAGTYYLYTSDVAGNNMTCWTSTNKLNWTSQGTMISAGAGGQWDHSRGVSNPFVWREGSVWYMLYEGGDGGLSSIGLATAAAATGPWTKWAGNPVLLGAGNGCGNPELIRYQNTVTRYLGRYYCYFHGTTAGNSGVQGRAWSTDLVTWTVEGDTGGVRFTHLPVWNGSTGYTYGDQCLYMFGGRSYLLYSPSDQVSVALIDGSIDHRSEIQLAANPPTGASLWTLGSVPVPFVCVR